MNTTTKPGVLAVIEDAPSVTVGGVTVLHNSVLWSVATNRHPSTDGTLWGWIKGAPGNICWENSKRFNRTAAGEVVASHNKWIEDQKPLSIRLVEARERYVKAKAKHDAAHAAYTDAYASLVKAEEAITSLAAFRGDQA